MEIISAIQFVDSSCADCSVARRICGVSDNQVCVWNNCVQCNFLGGSEAAPGPLET
jgi:hypothetical protein